MSTEYAPLRPPDPPRAGGNAGLPAKLDDSLLHSELVTQRNRAVTYAVAGAAMLLTRAVGLYDVHYLWTVAIFGLGLLSVGCFSLLALRAQRANRRADLAAWWIACDMVLVTAMVSATGGVSGPWWVWYLGCAGAAMTHLRLRLAVTFAAFAALLYLGALAAMGQIGGLDHGFYLAALKLLFLFGASLFLVVNTRKLLASTQLNQRLKDEANVRVEELTQVTRDLEAMSRLLRDFTETDTLTGLHNRRYLLDRVAENASQQGLEHSSRRAADRGRSAGIIMIDLDDFKAINDTYGHPAGDGALKHLAGILRQCVRDGDRLARWGGDEFLIFLPQVDRERIREVAERILSAVRSRPCSLPARGAHGFRGSRGSDGADGTDRAESSTFQLTCSIGWSAFDWLPRPDGASPWEQALAAADEALYAAKRDGRDRCCSLASGEPQALGTRLVAEPVAEAVEVQEEQEGVAAPAIAA
jgi:diguanylate cyclase (GGDEF)-like protein